MRNPGALVVARHYDDRHARLGKRHERPERLVRERRWHLGPVEQVSPVHHHVHLARPRRRQGPLVVGQEVVASPAPPHPGLRRQIEAEMRVGQEEDPDGRRVGHARTILCSEFLR
jgi:hypothetical protein